ncbi:MAG: glycosyltransferase family 2 protein [Melioribacteraceae bacterium]|nr:glycosyltransferase family 2 protein [Melioribacteraceae bacterium]
MNKLVSNYLKKHSVTEWDFAKGNKHIFNNVVVIPAIDEYENIIHLTRYIDELDEKYFDSTCFVFVINNSCTSSNEIKEANRKTLEYLRTAKVKYNFNFIDAATKGNEMPEKEAGVGLARKIGMDLALKLFDYNTKEKKLILCTDADCYFDKNYLTEVVEHFQKAKSGAGYVDYEHPLSEDETERKAVISYEIFLRYYVLGLQYAGSPYSFQTIGSTMVCDFESYIKIGGMNKKKAAEDFYFMEKLAKITSIDRIQGTKIYPAGRKSWRVPFGTGQRINRYLSGTHNEYQLYDPISFEILRKWINLFHNGNILTAEDYLDRANDIHIGLYSFLVENDFKNAWEKITKNSNSPIQINKQKKFWFDGFKTLKFIHYLRDKYLPEIGLFRAVEELLKVIGESSPSSENAMNDIDIQIKFLEKLRELT